MFAVMFCYLFFYTGRQTFGFAIPGMQKEFGLSKEALGWVSAIMLWSYAFGQAINGSLADKYGGRRVMTAGAVLSCLANWVMSFALGFKTLALPWGINGYFQALGWAPGSRILSNWWDRSERGKVYGLYVLAASSASVLSYVTSILVVGVFEMDWRWIFRLPVLLMLIGGMTFYIFVRDRPEDLGFKSPDTGMANDNSEPASQVDGETVWERYKAVLKHPKILIASISIGFMNAARYGLIVWVPVHFLGADWSKSPNSLIDPKWISIALPIGMAFGAISNGWISDKIFGSNRSKAIVLFMLIGALTSLGMYTESPGYVMLVTLFAAGFFVYGPASSFWALCPDLVGAKRSGTATGVMNAFAYVFAGFSEPLIGRLIDQSGHTSIIFPVVAGSCIASALIAVFIRR